MTDEQATRIEQKLDLLLSVIAVQQKDVCAAVGISPTQIRSKARKGDIDLLQKDGSRLNFVTLKDAAGLKPRRKAK